MVERIVIVAYDPSWPSLFRSVASRLRHALGDIALRIDHIGSTAIQGLDAKPIIDIQISVASLEPIDQFKVPIEQAGFVHRADNIERTKRFFRERPGDRRTHVHVRRAGTFSEQFPLLFREYLRAHPDRAQQYAALKRDLAARYSEPDERHLYVEAKVPFTWETIHLADNWAQAIGWEPPPSDA